MTDHEGLIFPGGIDDETPVQALRRLKLRLSELLNGIDAIELFARVSIYYLPHTLDSIREGEGEALPIHPEFLALQVLGIMSLGETSNQAKPDWPTTYEVMEVIQKLFHARYAQLFDIKFETAGAEPAASLALSAQAESLGIRVTAYPMHISRTLEGCFKNLEEPCREVLGFTAQEAFRLTEASAKILGNRIFPLFNESRRRAQILVKLMKHKRRKSKTRRQRSPMPSTEKPRLQKKLATASVFERTFDDSKTIVMVTAEELAAIAEVELGAAEKFLEMFSARPDEYEERHHGYPALSSPISRRPILKSDTGFIFVNHQLLLEAIRPRMEETLATSRYWERYQRTRARYLEEETVNLVASALSTSLKWNNINWRSSTLVGELDGLVSCDDATIRVQCKAGAVSEEARRGAPASMLETLYDLVGEASAQHERLSAALTDSESSSLGFTPEQSKALNTELQFELITTLDDVTAWTTEARHLQHVESHSRQLLAVNRPVPLVVSISDLMVVCDLLPGPFFVQYLLFRRRIEENTAVETHDELDWLGNFLGAGVDLDRVLGTIHESVSVRLLSHTSSIDYWYLSNYAGSSDSTKPSVEVPPLVRDFVSLLETTRPIHWMSGALALLEGQGERKLQTNLAISEGLRKFNKGQIEVFSAVRRPGLGIAMVFDPLTTTLEMSARMRHFAERVSSEQQLRFCIGVGYSSSREVVVSFFGETEEFRLMDALIQPLIPQ